MKVQRFRSKLHSLFWGLYGRHAWDDQREPSGVSEPPERIADLLGKRRRRDDEWVLDAGCGTGNYAVALARMGFRVIGIDFAPSMLAKARAKAEAGLADRISFQRVDLNLPLGFPAARFDHVIAISVLQTSGDPLITLRELRRVLKPGGTLVLSLPKADSPVRSQSLGGLIRYRIQHLERRTPGKKILVILKSIADRLGNRHSWTMEHARQMLEENGFKVLSAEEGRQILAVAEKTVP